MDSDRRLIVWIICLYQPRPAFCFASAVSDVKPRAANLSLQEYNNFSDYPEVVQKKKKKKKQQQVQDDFNEMEQQLVHQG